MDDNNDIALSAQEEVEAIWKDYSLEDYLSLAIFWVLISLVLLQVISRYVFNNSFIWSEELARYHFIMLTFIGATVAARHGSLVKIEFFSSLLPTKGKFILAIVVNMIEIVFLAITIGLAWQMFLFMCNKKMVSLNVSMGVLYFVVFFGILVITVRTIQLFILHLRRPVYSLSQSPKVER
jgi:TRAP-type C4-dicarboxylate transport system permease small subunit